MSERSPGFSGEEFLQKKYDLGSSDEAGEAVRRAEGEAAEANERLREEDKEGPLESEEISRPEARIRAYLDRLVAVLEPAEREGGHIDRKERNLNTIKRFLHEDLLIEAEPAVDAFIAHQRTMARNLGHGNVPELPAEMRSRIVEAVDDVAWGEAELGEATQDMEPAERQVVEEVVAKREAQRTSLDAWVDYLTSDDAKDYPDWFKYWAFRSIMGMAEYDKDTKAFPSRDETTVNPFPTLDQACLAKVLDAVNHHEEYRAQVDAVKAEIAAAKRAQVSRAQEKQINRRMGELRRENPGAEIDRAGVMRELGIESAPLPDLPEVPADTRNLTKEALKAFNDRDFATLYAREFSRLETTSDALLRNTNGEWRTYPKGSDAAPLVDSIERHKTGWCTAGQDVATSQLSRGDFSVYYSEDEQGEFTVPRAAIRMEGDKIAEVRGIAPNQNLDPYIGEVVQKKMHEFPDGKEYEKKAADMQRLTEIEAKTTKNQPLTKDDLTFLYELDSTIEGFGYQKDPRIKELLDKRNPKEDAPLVFDCEPREIAWSPQDLTPASKAYIGPLFKGVFELDHLEHLYTSFREGRIRKYQVELGGKTPEEYQQELEKGGFQIYDYAEQILPKMAVSKKPETADLVRLTVADLGFKDATRYDELCRCAKELGLDLAPAEAGPASRLRDKDQPMNDYYVMAMEPLAGADDRPGLFDVGRHADGKRWLHASRGYPGNEWGPKDSFVFSRRKH
jgi:hypothetical protein